MRARWLAGRADHRFDGASQSLLERDDRFVAQDALNPVQAGQRVADVAGPRVLKNGFEVGSQNLVERCDQVEQADAMAGADVEDLAQERLRARRAARLAATALAT